MNRRDLLSYFGCSAVILTLIGKDARPCSTCGSLLHTRHRHEQKHNHYQQVSPPAKPRLSMLTLTKTPWIKPSIRSH